MDSINLMQARLGDEIDDSEEKRSCDPTAFHFDSKLRAFSGSSGSTTDFRIAEDIDCRRGGIHSRESTQTSVFGSELVDQPVQRGFLTERGGAAVVADPILLREVFPQGISLLGK